MAYLLYCVMGGALGAGPGPVRRFRFCRRRKQKNTSAIRIMRPAAPPTTPPTIAPVWFFFMDPAPSVGVADGEAVCELGGSSSVEVVDGLESVSLDVELD